MVQSNRKTELTSVQSKTRKRSGKTRIWTKASHMKCPQRTMSKFQKKTRQSLPSMVQFSTYLVFQIVILAWWEGNELLENVAI